MSHLEKNAKLTDGQTDNRQTDNSDFIGPSVGRGSNKHKCNFHYVTMLMMTS